MASSTSLRLLFLPVLGMTVFLAPSSPAWAQAPVPKASETIECGSGKTIEAKLYSYNDGSFVLETYSHDTHLFEGFWPQVYFVASDGQGNVIAVSQVFQLKTCGSALDPFWPSHWREQFRGSVSPAVARSIKSVKIFASDRGRSQDPHDQLIENLRKLGNVIKEGVNMVEVLKP
jgi:hypothetical protein